jgi:hypothetical protein
MGENYLAIGFDTAFGNPLGDMYGVVIGYDPATEQESRSKLNWGLTAHPTNKVLYHGENLQSAQQAIADLLSIEQFFQDHRFKFPGKWLTTILAESQSQLG